MELSSADRDATGGSVQAVRGADMIHPLLLRPARALPWIAGPPPLGSSCQSRFPKPESFGSSLEPRGLPRPQEQIHKARLAG
ncbi:MAG: hypothetical protein K8U57_36030 [Planctomycetes bacterium]|nr:hypothetical protein [Planctomycetota bacterium]